jgi:hypothetical protein
MSTLNTYNLKSPDSANTNLALDASGNVAIQAGSASAPSIYITGDTNTGIYSSGADQVAISTNGTGRLFIDSSGRLGLGTSTFSYLANKLVVDKGSTSNDGITIVGGSASNACIWFAKGTSGSDAYRGGIDYNFSTDKMQIYTGANGGITIDASNRLGIGTTTPGAELHVNPGAGNVGNIYLDYGTGSSTDGRLNIEVGLSAVLYETIKTGGLAQAWYVTGAERARIDTAGRFLVGTSNAIDNSTGTLLQLKQNDNPASIALGRNDGVITAGDELGNIKFYGTEQGTTPYDFSAQIGGHADGSWTTTSFPSRLMFSTTSDSASSPTERARITSGGYLKVSNNGSYFNSTGAYHEFTNTTNVPALILRTTDGSQTDTTLSISPSRAANSAYKMLMCYSGNEADLEFNLRGDGNAYADGSWNGGGADYAEYFEWNDGNPDAEDRRGVSVVLDGNKIRPAVDGEDPIGVISGNPSVVGDAAWNKWNGKYLRDDFGSYVLDETGERHLNPAYDPDVEYISREDRPEWDCVGLMGKLRIRKGQPTGNRWIKMRDISDSVEEWLVR